MTDMISLAKRLYKKIEWQAVPDDVTREDLSEHIAEGIRNLYVMTGRSSSFTEDMFGKSGELYTEFSADLALDEQNYVLCDAAIEFYKKVQSTVDTLTSYTTDAMAVTHGDKPFANLQQKIDDLSTEKNRIWYKMVRFHHL